MTSKVLKITNFKNLILVKRTNKSFWNQVDWSLDSLNDRNWPKMNQKYKKNYKQFAKTQFFAANKILRY